MFGLGKKNPTIKSLETLLVLADECSRKSTENLSTKRAIKLQKLLKNNLNFDAEIVAREHADYYTDESHFGKILAFTNLSEPMFYVNHVVRLYINFGDLSASSYLSPKVDNQMALSMPKMSRLDRRATVDNLIDLGRFVEKNKIIEEWFIRNIKENQNELSESRPN